MKTFQRVRYAEGWVDSSRPATREGAVCNRNPSPAMNALAEGGAEPFKPTGRPAVARQ